jgi:trehalose/maltose hydrolase-like predicted phosphorylase
MRMRVAVPILGLISSLLCGADRTFIVETQSWTPYTPTYLGSGLIGLSSSRLGTDPAESFMAGVYDHGPGDVPRLTLLPAWNAVDVYNGRNWLNHTTSARAYHQTLDMYDGSLRTQYDWVDGDRVIGVTIQAFVSRSDPTLGAIHLEITPRFSGAVKVSLPLTAWPEPKRYPLAKLQKLPAEAQDQQTIWYGGHMTPQQTKAQRGAHEARLEMVAKPEGTNMVIAEAASLDWPADLQPTDVATQQTSEACGIDISFSAASGQTYAFNKYVVIESSINSAKPVETATSGAQRSRSRGFAALLQSSANAWHELWQEDIQIDGDPNLQTVIHSMLFYLLGSATDRWELSIPPMGLSTAGYYGHVFWDADTFMFPVLMALHPEMAKSTVMFRYRTLDAARRNAKQNGRLGAMYPWEAGPDGAETTPRFAYQNALQENHINADVALAEWQYFLATGDRKWLDSYGYPIIHDTADFWISRVTYNKDMDRYEIHGVVSVDESKIGVTDDPYTNAAAKKNLEIAIMAARTLGKNANPKWAGIAQKLYLPRKDLILLDYPLELPLSEAEKRSILKQALQESTGRQSGVMMEVEFRPIPAVELRDQSPLQTLLDNSYRPYLRPPFNVLPETPTNNNINFLTGAGAFLQQFIFGYAGLRFSPDTGLSQKYAPLLPERIKRLVLRNVSVRGRRIDITVPGAK